MTGRAGRPTFLSSPEWALPIAALREGHGANGLAARRHASTHLVALAKSRTRMTMCGVIGYVGRRAAKERLLRGLERLEYRGYDSSGICLSGSDGLDSVKAVGKLENLKLKADGLVSRVHGRHRPHPLGDARPRDRGERPPAHGGRGPVRRDRAQRHHRELRRDQAGPDRRRRPLQLGDRRRGGRPPHQALLLGRPGRGRARDVRPAQRPLRLHRDPPRPSGACSSARAISAR